MKKLFILLSLTLVLNGIAFCQTQDTVRVGDPRFMFSQITDSSYFYNIYENRRFLMPHNIYATYADSSTHRLQCISYTTEHKVDKQGMVLYGVAVVTWFSSPRYYNYQYHDFSVYEPLPWDSVHDTVWLKLRRGSDVGYIDGGRAIDSIRISHWSEQKTLQLQGHPYSWDWEHGGRIILLDSTIYEEAPLFCGYFDTPVRIDDTNFFTSIELLAHFETPTIPDDMFHCYPGIYVATSCINTDVIYFKYYKTDNPCGAVEGWCPYTEKEWPVVLPILAPQGTPNPNWTPDPDPDPNSIAEAATGKCHPDVSVFPNPARKVFSLRSDERIQKVELYDAMGRPVRVWNGSHGTYSTDNIAPGVYSLRIVTPHGVTTESLAIVR